MQVFALANDVNGLTTSDKLELVLSSGSAFVCRPTQWPAFERAPRFR